VKALESSLDVWGCFVSVERIVFCIVLTMVVCRRHHIKQLTTFRGRWNLVPYILKAADGLDGMLLEECFGSAQGQMNGVI
jgi:hypothetical protein